MAINNFKPFFATATQAGGTVTVVTSDTGKTSMLLGLDICNTHTTGIQVNVWLRSGGTDYQLINGAPIPQGSTLKVIENQKHVLLTGDSVKVQVTTLGASITVVGSLVEIA